MNHGYKMMPILERLQRPRDLLYHYTIVDMPPKRALLLRIVYFATLHATWGRWHLLYVFLFVSTPLHAAWGPDKSDCLRRHRA